MSTYLRASKSEQAISLDDLRGYFQAHGKPVSRHQLGVEWELFGNVRDTLAPLPYYGTSGIEAVLRWLSVKFGYQILEERGHAIALFRGQNYVALEPGGQLELSAEPVETIHDIKKQLDQFRQELVSVADNLPVTWFTAGFHPFARFDQMDWVPKKRYEIMRDYLTARGEGAQDMMKRTAANQVSVDYSDEQDAMEKLRIIYALTSLVSALFSHSPLSEGKLNGYLTYRMHAWRNTDAERTGLLPIFLEEFASFEEYLDYVFNAPMIFIIRGEAWVPMKGVRFREFLFKGHDGFWATKDDFELHLSTLFPEARLKNCIEIRGADGQLFELVPAVTAFWKGVLYDKLARHDVWEIVRDFTWEERCLFHRDMEKQGLRAMLGQHRGWELIREILVIARRGLRAQNRLNGRGQDESFYLDLLMEKVVKPEKTPAEILIEKWEHEFQGNGIKLLNYLSLP